MAKLTTALLEVGQRIRIVYRPVRIYIRQGSDEDTGRRSMRATLLQRAALRASLRRCELCLNSCDC